MKKSAWILKFALFFAVGVKPGLFQTKWAVKSFNHGIAVCTWRSSMRFSLALHSSSEVACGMLACHRFIAKKKKIKKCLIKSEKSCCIIKMGESIFSFLCFVKFIKYYISLQIELHTVQLRDNPYGLGICYLIVSEGNTINTMLSSPMGICSSVTVGAPDWVRCSKTFLKLCKSQPFLLPTSQMVNYV